MAPDAIEPSTSSPRSVLVITVSFRTAEMVMASMRALAEERERAAADGISVRAVIVDNASGDTPLLRKGLDEAGFGSWVTLITAEKNGGFAYGNNVGFRHAYASGSLPDYFFLLNPDAQVRPGALSTMVRFFEAHPRAGTAGSSLEDEHGVLHPIAFRFPSLLSEVNIGLSLGVFSRVFEKHVVARRMGNVAEEVDWFPGAAMMIRREVIDELGGMDESYFLYFEETDFCLKVKRAGWSNWYVPESRCMHMAGQSTGVTGQKARHRPLPTYWFESRRRYFMKNFGETYAKKTDAVFLIAHLLGMLKSWAQRRHHGRPNFVREFVRTSVIRPQNRRLDPAREFRPEELSPMRIEA